MLNLTQAPTVLDVLPTLPCAWCNAEQGIPQGVGSHGICPTHTKKMQREIVNRRAERARREAIR